MILVTVFLFERAFKLWSRRFFNCSQLEFFFKIDWNRKYLIIDLNICIVLNITMILSW